MHKKIWSRARLEPSNWEAYHDDHAIRRLKKYLMEKIESQLGKPFHESWGKYRQDLETSILSLVRKSEKLKNQISNMESELPIMLQHKEWLKQYNEVSKTNETSAVSQSKEIFILLKVSESGLLDLKHFTDETANSKSVQTEREPLSKSSAETKSHSPLSDDDNFFSAIRLQISKNYSCRKKYSSDIISRVGSGPKYPCF